MADSIRGIFKEQESLDRLLNPLGRLSTQMSEQADIYARSDARGGIIEALRKEEERRDLALGSLSAMGVAQTVREINRFAGIGDHLRSNSSLQYIDQQPNFVSLATQAASARTAYERSFRLPLVTELGGLASAAMSASKLARDVLGVNDAFTSALSKMHMPWAHIGEEISSASAMSEIIAMGRGIRIKGAFNEDFSNALRVNLGDWRDTALPPSESMLLVVDRMGIYGAMGVNPELSDFPASAFDESLRSAELIEGEEANDSPRSDDDAARAHDAFVRLRLFEVKVRRFIDRRMREEFGDQWALRQVPEDMREGWQRKRATAAQHEDGERPLIDYADFADYKTIIEKKDNWTRVFKAIFNRPEDIRESFLRLFPVRIATMHARAITQDDVLLLLVETKRVLKAIGEA